MRNYTAIYSSKTLKNIQYGFKAENTESAVNFCRGYFSEGAFESMIIVENPIWGDRIGVVVWANGFEVVHYAHPDYKELFEKLRDENNEDNEDNL